MNIILKRIRYRPETIDGQIWIDGEKICSSAENANHCLPVGIYPIRIIKCKQYARKMPLICLEDNTREALVTGGNALGDNAEREICLEGSTLPPCNQCPKLGFFYNNTNMPCYCPQLSPGNGAYNRIDGAILVGNYIAPGCLKHPKSTFDYLYQRIRKSVERGHEMHLIITSI